MRATLAQVVEQLIRNQQVVCSNPTGGSNRIKHFSPFNPSLTIGLCPILCPPSPDFDGRIDIFEPRNGGFFRFLPDVTVVLHHLAAHVASECANGLLTVVRILEKPRDEGVTQIMPAVLHSRLPNRCTPPTLPLPSWSLELNTL